MWLVAAGAEQPRGGQLEQVASHGINVLIVLSNEKVNVDRVGVGDIVQLRHLLSTQSDLVIQADTILTLAVVCVPHLKVHHSDQQ